jgi:hypothetical protein
MEPKSETPRKRDKFFGSAAIAVERTFPELY